LDPFSEQVTFSPATMSLKGPLFITSPSLVTFPIPMVTKTFVTSSPHHVPLIRNFSSPLFLNHLLLASHSLSHSANQIHHIQTLHLLLALYKASKKCPTNIFTLKMATSILPK
jgi:hypothetical protein